MDRETALRIIKNLLAGLLITWGALALLVRAATPLLGDWRNELAATLAERLGTPVAIARLEARWYGFSPLLELHRVALGTAPERIEVDRIAFDLAPGGLFDGLADSLRVTIDGLQLTAIREPGGQLHLEGFGPVAAGGTSDGALPPLPRHIHLVNTRMIWVDRRTGRPPLTLDDVNIALDRDGSRLNLRARLDSPAGEAELSARLNGFLATTAWQGETYLRVRNLDAARLFGDHLPRHYGLDRLSLDFESWTRWADAKPVDMRGDVRLRNLLLRATDGRDEPLQLTDAAAQFTLHRDAQGLRLGLRDLSLDLGAYRWPAGDLALSLSEEAGNYHLAAAADYLRIEDMVRILRVRLPWDAMAEPLARLQPRGEVRDLRLQATFGAEPPSWRVSARVDGITTGAWEGIPAITNISGRVHAQQDHVVLHLDSRDASVDLARLFRDPIELRALSGRLDLVRRADGWEVASERLVADTPHMRTVTRLVLRDRADQPLFLDLQTDFEDGDAAFASRYYPVTVMGPSLVRWLDRSIKSGHVLSGTALVYGPLADFAFEKTRSGIFQVLFDAEDVVLDYREGWPRLDGVAAKARFHGNQLDIEARDARIYDSRVIATVAHIESLEPTSPLQIRGRLDGPLRNTLKVLGEGALRDRFGQFAEILRGDGDSTLLLDFQVPLASRGEYALDGTLKFDGNALALPEQDITLTDIVGRLDFTLDGLKAEGIRARTLGAPVTVDVLPLAEGTTRVRTRGRFEVPAIARQLPMLPLQAAHGGAAFEVRVDVPPARAGGGRATRVGVDSDLAGIGIDLPSPFGKARDESRRLAVTIPVGSTPGVGSLSYGTQVSAHFSSDARQIDVRLGGRPAQRSDSVGIRVNGALADADLGDWYRALSLIAPGGFTLGDGVGIPVAVDLRIARLQVEQNTFEPLRLQVTRDAGAWRGRFDATRLAGSFRVPASPGDDEPVRIDVERLAIALPVGGQASDDTGPADPGDGPDPTRLPPLSLRIADLAVNDARFGRLALIARSATGGLEIDELSLQGGELTIQAKGGWRHDGRQAVTHLAGNMNSARLGDLLVHLGYSRQLEDAPSRVGFDLQWPGHPAAAHRSTVRGTVGIEVDRGRLVELDPGVTRVVGLLNLNALTRRLRLDFSDFYKKGYSFDSIRGDFAVAAGDATTDNLTVVGPTGRIEVRGSADLVRRTLDQHVDVTPNLDATLPIAGTIAGGPVAGIAVLVAQKVMSDEVDRLNRFAYSLSGPWDDPTIEQLDSGGTLSKILGGGRRSDDAEGASTSTAGPAQDAPKPTDKPDAGAAPAGDGDGNPLRGLVDLLKKGESHGADLPGAEN